MKVFNRTKKQIVIEKQFSNIRKDSSAEIINLNHPNNIFISDGFYVLQSHVFDLQEYIDSGKRTFVKQFESHITNYIAVEVLISNPFYNKRDSSINGLSKWYFEDEEVGRNNFSIEIKREWEVIELVQSWGTPAPGFWKTGDCRVEILVEDNILCSHNFVIGDSQIICLPDDSNKNIRDEKINISPLQTYKQNILAKSINETYPINSTFEELNKLIGLKNLKNSLTDFINYINFVIERKNKGIQTEENLTAHCIFLGNPGTGKTSVARLLGKFFKSIGLLENGHVIEVDRSALIGEYIGETAQKTDRVISQALGGILFIDEAYTLKRNKADKDFGQEAIDIILKRMEDYRGKFFVIAAGYPDLMQNFLESNPGLKSRFTHTFKFEDFSTEELVEIFISFSAKEKFNITDKAKKLLKEKLDIVKESPDSSFGNARFIRNIFNDTKIQLSKRYHSLPYEEKNFSTLSTITKEDILNAFNYYKKNVENSLVNEDKLERYIIELNNLIGLEDVKNTFNKLLASIRVDQLKKDRFISSTPKNLNSIFISEQGSGTSSVARLFGKIFKELSLLDKGHLVEIDSSIFYGLNKIDSYLMIDKIFQESIGNIILVNDSILTLQAESDFSDSLLQYFLKKLYLYKDKSVVILSGNRTELEKLFNNVPVIENQFPNIFDFGRYSNRQLLEIALEICQKKNYILDEGAWQQMLEVLSELRKEKMKNFYNARTIKEILNKVIFKQEERIIRITNPKDDDLMTIKFEDFTGLVSSNN